MRVFLRAHAEEKPGKLDVPHFKVHGVSWHLQERRTEYRRPIHRKLRPEDGWKFITAELPEQKTTVPKAERFRDLQEAVERHREDGLEHEGRRYFFVSASASVCNSWRVCGRMH